MLSSKLPQSTGYTFSFCDPEGIKLLKPLWLLSSLRYTEAQGPHCQQQQKVPLNDDTFYTLGTAVFMLLKDTCFCPDHAGKARFVLLALFFKKRNREFPTGTKKLRVLQFS